MKTATAAKFTEVGKRVKVSDTREITASKVTEGKTLKGINMGSYIVTASYTGFAKGGIFVPADKISEFKQMVAAL
jgi:hypothetical protein